MKKYFLVIVLLFFFGFAFGQINPTISIKPGTAANQILITKDTFGAKRFIYADLLFNIVNDTLYFIDSSYVNLVPYNGSTPDNITITGAGTVGNPLVRENYSVYTKQSGGEIITQINSNYIETNILSDIISGELDVVKETPTDNSVYGYVYGSVWDSDSIFIQYTGNSYRTNIDGTKEFRDNYMFGGTGVTYYCNSIYGNDSNDGLSESTPLRSIEAAKAKSDVNTIMVKSGNYYDTKGFSTAVTNDSINIIGYDGEVITGSAIDRTFAQNWYYDNVYQTQYSGLTGVVSTKKVDEHGTPEPWKEVASILEVSKNNNSFFYGPGDTMYVNSNITPITGVDLYLIRGISKSVLITTATANPVKLYIEGITILGGAIFRADEAGNELRALNCKFVHQYSSGNDGALQIQSIEKVYLNNCIAAYSITDGFNYHDVGNYVVKPFVLELNCKAYKSGIDLGSSDQASTLHEDYRAIRVNGLYHSDGEQCIHDANESFSINLGTHAKGRAINRVFGIDGNVGIQKMWIVNPIMGASNIISSGNANCTIYVSGLDYKNISYLGTGSFQIR